MKQYRVLATLAAFLFVALFLLAFHLHYAGIREVRSQFEKGQLSYARHLSNQIQFYIQARSRGLRALSSLVSLKRGNAQQQRLDIEAYGKQMEKIYVKRISLYDDGGDVVFSTNPEETGVKEGESSILAWARRMENREKILLTPASREAQSLTFVLAIPLYPEGGEAKSHQGGSRMAGILAFTLDMKGFLADQLGSADPEMSLDRIWIMDKDGTLLFQADHPEMVFRNINQREGNCRQCHTSFHYVEEVLIKERGTLDYEIKGHPKRIAAFASMKFEEVSWVVVVNTPYDRVTGFVKRSLREHLSLLGIIVLAFAVGSILVIRNERMKIKAEEEVVRWQEKMLEREKAEETLQLERNKLKRILDSMNDAVYIVNREYEVLYTNPMMERGLGPIRGRKCYEYLHDQLEVCNWCKIPKVLTGETVRWEWHSFKTGKTYELFDTPFVGPDGSPCKLGISRDISDQKRAERALRQSEKRFRVLVETMNEGLGMQDEHGDWIYVNDRFCEMLGYSRDEMIGQPVTHFLTEADQLTYEEQTAKRRRGEVQSYELMWEKKDGQRIFTRISPKAISDGRGQFKGSFAIITDITERKQAEEALKESERQLRFLSSQLLSAQETERKRISRELHDELGQSLTVMKLRLSFIEKNLREEEAGLKAECDSGIRYIDQLIENIRRLSRDLSPTILEDFGLSAALRWLINNFAKSYTIRVVLDMIDVDSLLPRDSHIVVYRTVQEALTNIGKHSRAKNAFITIRNDGDRVLFHIDDDGAGFDEKGAASKSPEEKGLGLTTMKGRVQMVGGTLQIRSEEGKGTQIILSVPIERKGTS